MRELRERSRTGFELRRSVFLTALLAGGVSPVVLGQPLTITHLAGPIGGPGWFDGTGAQARFRGPVSVARDAAGNAYVADTYNHTIRKIGPSGAVTTLAGLADSPGSNDGTSAAARFHYPAGVAVDGAGTVYVADCSNHTIRKVSPTGDVSTFAGLAGSAGGLDGTGPAARFSCPEAIAVDVSGVVFVAGNHTIRRISAAGEVTTLAGSPGVYGSTDGTGSQARFYAPTGVAVDASGNVYVADQLNHTIRTVTPSGTVTTLAGQPGSYGSTDGTGSVARFWRPSGIAVDASGTVYVAGNWNHTIRAVSPGGSVTTLAGTAGSRGDVDGTGSAARFMQPYGIAADASGGLWVAELGNHTVRRVTAGGVVSTLAGSAAAFGVTDGAGSQARFWEPFDVTVDQAGTVYVADFENDAIRKISAAGAVTTVAGVGGSYGAGAQDGTGTAARFSGPVDVAVGPDGNVYVSDFYNCTIRKMTPDGTVTTLAGLGSACGYADGAGSAARFWDPRGLDVDASGNVYVADSFLSVIRKVSPSGVVTTLAGLAGSPGSADGTGSDARFHTPAGLAVDEAGDLLVADQGNHTIRRVTATGVVTTLAGLAGSPGAADGAGTAARFNYPAGLDVDAAGNLLVAEQGNHTIRIVSATGVVTTAAGLTGRTGSADGTGSSALFSSPTGVAVGPDGSVFVADSGNNAVRKGAPSLPDSATVDQASGPVGELRQLGAVPRSASSWLWEEVGIPAGSAALLSSTSTADPAFVPDVPGRYVFRLTAGSGSAASVTTVDVTAWETPSAVVSGGRTICQGSAATLSVQLAGTPPWSLTWSDGVTQSGITTSPVTRLVSPESTTVYVVTQLSDANASGSGTGTATVTVAGALPPTELSAPGSALPGAAGITVSVPDAGAGATYSWTVTNGTITAGQGTATVTLTTGVEGLCGVSVAVTNSSGCTSTGSRSIRVGFDPAPPLTFTDLAGGVGGAGWFDGTGSAARFHTLAHGAVDAQGNVYVADWKSHTIRRVTPSGVVTTLAGVAEVPGGYDGPGNMGRFRAPRGVAVDGSGNVYVADSGNNLIRKVTASGLVTTIAGGFFKGTADGVGTAARFWDPWDLALDSGGNLYIVDTGNRTIRRMAPDGSVTTVAGLAGSQGSSDGTGSAARFGFPSGIAVDPSGNVWVTDEGNHTLRRMTPDGTVTTVAGLAGSPGSADGTGSTARFQFPDAVAVDGAGNVFVADTYNCTVRKVTAAGFVTTLAGLAPMPGHADGTGSAARFTNPGGLAVDGAGNVFVMDTYNRTIRKISPGAVVTTLAGLASPGGYVDGPASAARFIQPIGVAVGWDGRVVVADETQLVRQIAPDGTVTTLAGHLVAGVGGYSNGVGTAAAFNTPSGVAIDADGNAYIADRGNFAIRKVTPAGVVTTFAGAPPPGSPGSADGMGTLARFQGPRGVAIDGFGNLYVADSGASTIRKVSASGMVTTLAGLANSIGSADGTGSQARFYAPRGVAVDGTGNVYVADFGNGTIRKISPSGDVTTLAGLAWSGGNADGTGSQARFRRPSSIGVDGSGTIYVADPDNSLIRRVTPSGVVTTVGSRGEYLTGSADGTGTFARFWEAPGIAVGYEGDLYVADLYNRKIRRGATALPDVATVDQPIGAVGQARQLDTSPQTATSWRWEQVRVPTGSTATLTATSVRNPVFTPDIAGYYVFRLTATTPAASSITHVALAVTPPGGASAVVSGGGAICAGQTYTVQADLGGTPPWRVVWSDGWVYEGVTSSPLVRTMTAYNPGAFASWEVAEVSNANGLGQAVGKAVLTVLPVPATPVVTAPASVAAGTAGLLATVAAHAGATYAWSITNGTITGGQGTAQVTFRAGSAGTLSLSVVETDAAGCASLAGTAAVTVFDQVLPLRFSTLTPCRVLDTRGDDGPLGGPVLAPSESRVFPVAGSCGVPATARSVSVNVTVTQPSAPGYLSLFEGGGAAPLASTINFAPGQTRANNAVIRLASDGAGTLAILNGSTGSAHVILDVNGYFE